MVPTTTGHGTAAMAGAPLKASVDPVTGEILETPELRSEGLAQLRAAIAADQAKAGCE